MRAEAYCLQPRVRIARGDAVKVDPAYLLSVTGVGESAAQAGVRSILQAGPEVLISWGVAGGLDPALPAGTLLLPKTVHSGGTDYDVDPHWWRCLQGRLRGRKLDARPLLHSTELLRRCSDKAAAYRRSGAASCDMESGVIAREAARARIPFVVLRVVCDPADRALPSWLVGGHSISRRVLRAAAHPGDWPLLYRLAGDFRIALRSLEQAADALRGSIYARISPVA